MKFYVVGDIHQDSKRLNGAEFIFENPKDTAIIVLGDFGANFFCDDRDYRFKKKANKMGIQWYAVKGNHEERPGRCKNMKLEYDSNIGGEVWTEVGFPNIHYFKEYGIYQIGDYKCAIIGGAYSVDKFYRLQNGWKWFEDEQLEDWEKEECEKLLNGEEIDFVFTHTCPRSWEPTELFLSMIDQSLVDTSTEDWMEKLKDTFKWKYWIFGHFHKDLLIRPYAEMFYTDVQSLDEIAERWDRYFTTGELDWWLIKSQKFYMD